MLRLYDTTTQAARELRPGPLRIQVHSADPRVQVTADVLRRVADRSGHQVLIGYSGPVPDWDPAELNVQPMEWPPGDADVHVGAETAEADGCFVTVAPGPPSWADADPPAVRLAMLSTHYRTPIEPGQVLDVSTDRLRRWRELVAAWANSPGRPMSAGYVAAAGAAFDDDLDTPAVLSLLDRLAEDAEVPPGSKFETFVHLDLILALDLVSAIGR
jgi:nucleotide-binding universal stress UspA family protein